MMTPTMVYIIIASLFAIINLAIMFYKDIVGIPGIASNLMSTCCSIIVTALILNAIGPTQLAWVLVCLSLCSNLSAVTMVAVSKPVEVEVESNQNLPKA